MFKVPKARLPLLFITDNERRCKKLRACAHCGDKQVDLGRMNSEEVFSRRRRGGSRCRVGGGEGVRGERARHFVGTLLFANAKHETIPRLRKSRTAAAVLTRTSFPHGPGRKQNVQRR